MISVETTKNIRLRAPGIGSIPLDGAEARQLLVDLYAALDSPAPEPDPNDVVAKKVPGHEAVVVGRDIYVPMAAFPPTVHTGPESGDAARVRLKIAAAAQQVVKEATYR